MPDAPLPPKTDPSRAFLAAALLFSTAAFAWTVSRPLPALLSIVPDDAFYYLTTARNIAQKGLSSFDGLNPTNGYHPGWMAIMVAVAKVFDDPVALVRACLVTAFAFHLASALVLTKALSVWLPRSSARVGGALWALNSLPVNFAIQGMEACFYIFGLAVAFFVYSARLSGHSPKAQDRPSVFDFALFGASLGLCFFGRTEASVLAAAAIVAVAWRFRRVAAFEALLVTGAAFAASIVPWFVYSRFATGSWFQHSGSMKMLWAAEGSAHSTTRLLDAMHYVFGNWAAYPIVGIPGGRWSGLRALVASAITLVLVAALWRGRQRSETREPAWTGMFLLAATLATGSVYGLFFSEQQYWYKAQPAFVLFLVSYGAAALAMSSNAWSLGRVRRVAMAATASLVVALTVRLATLNSYPWQNDVMTSQRAFDEMVPEGELIGCFNAGIPGFFGKHVVVNLDGLMNNTVYDYYRERRFDRYLTDAKIRYVADEVEALGRGMIFVQEKVPLTVVTTVPLTGWSSGRRYLWRVAGGAAPSLQ
ncbi:MAG TPA: hypothetical protein VJT73_08405 [Polyangiaceae bacterium]|nr:hypothetical protein [Polyangiaceae bacterium]